MTDNSIPQDLNEWFIEPILEIPLGTPETNESFRILLHNRLSTDLDKSLNVIKQNIDFLLDLNTKNQLMDFLYSLCPPNDHHYVTWFKRLLGRTCGQIVDIYQDEDILKINDITAEYWAGHFQEYSIKIYQNRGSLQRLREEAKYILEEITGIEPIISYIDSGLGGENHISFRVQSEINEEVLIYLHFIQPRKRKILKNNIYVIFWSRNAQNLWNDVSLATITMICDFLNKILSIPELEVINVNISNYKTHTNLPEQIVEAIDLVGSIKTPLKHDRIIERAIKFNEDTYNTIIREINTNYIHYCFTGMYILIRKLLENLVLDSLKKFYGTDDIMKYFNPDKGKFLGFNKLRENFQEMIGDSNFIQRVNTIDQKVMDWLLLFKETGDIHAHSTFSVPHQSLIEENKESLNRLIKILTEIKNNLSR